MRRSRLLGVLGATFYAATLAHAAPVAVVVSGGAVAPAQPGAGPGLCITSAKSTNPAADFGTATTATYNQLINNFIEAHVPDRVTYVQRTVLDLSNNNNTGLRLSYGDFTFAMAGCLEGGCDFAPSFNDSITSFASRLRGYFNVTQAMVGQELHLGFYTDDAVSLVFYDRTQRAYPVVTRPPQLGLPTWRTTNSVTFSEAGLYPLEILYVEIAEHAALELSLLQGAFVDFELPANQPGSTSLQTSGFRLALPDYFFLTENGRQPFPTPTQCLQCNRQFVNQAGNGDCGVGTGLYCNAAALCAPCDSSTFCGPSCSPCGQAQPYCVNINAQYQCAECRDDTDCADGRICDPASKRCLPCSRDDHCPKGMRCEANQCVACDAQNSCAGSSCNCCPTNTVCAVLGSESAPRCVECTSDADCAQGTRCDGVSGRCLSTLPECHTPDRCGPTCQSCPIDRPYCLLDVDSRGRQSAACGACRSDNDCGAGKYCSAGQCSECTVNRRCGPRCGSCGGDTPLCTSNGTAASARCVSCLADGDCPGSSCDRNTGQCTTRCTPACPAGQVCYGTRCVECYANSQCPCGGSCDLTTNRCTDRCSTSSDCQGSEYCDPTNEASQKMCYPGRILEDSEPDCHCCTGRVAPRPRPDGRSTPGEVFGLALVPALLLGVLLAARRRQRHSADQEMS